MYKHTENKEYQVLNTLTFLKDANEGSVSEPYVMRDYVSTPISIEVLDTNTIDCFYSQGKIIVNNSPQTFTGILYTLVGKKIQTFIIQKGTSEILVSNIPSGIYILHINGCCAQKIVVGG